MLRSLLFQRVESEKKAPSHRKSTFSLKGKRRGEVLVAEKIEKYGGKVWHYKLIARANKQADLASLFRTLPYPASKLFSLSLSLSMI